MATPVKVLERPPAFFEEFTRKPGADKTTTHYCPGCGHGVVHKIIAEAMTDFGIQDRTIFVSPVGCSVFAYYYFHCGNVQVAHGRAPAAATGIKRSRPDSIVITYQGDGDLAGIGGNNILQAANRGEAITVIFVNNAIYGMTGGQMAPTTLLGQKTTTTPQGRASQNEGYPLRVAELLSTLEAPVYIERTAVTDAKNVMKTRKAVRRAIMNQIENRGFSMVEVLSSCPTGWNMTPTDAKQWLSDVLVPVFPLGVKKDVDRGVLPAEMNGRHLSRNEYHDILGIDHAAESAFERPVVAERYANPSIKVAGFGGQGVLMLGVILANGGMEVGYEVSWLPSYGPEMRGGTANCHVKISDGPIGSPLVSLIDVLFAFNRPSLDKFEPFVRPGGLIVYDNSIIDRSVEREDVEALPLPATKLADDLGNTRTANVVAIGAYLARTGLLPDDAVKDTLAAVLKRKELLDLNLKALEVGRDYARSVQA